MHPRGLQIHCGFCAYAPEEKAIEAAARVVATMAAPTKVVTSFFMT